MCSVCGCNPTSEDQRLIIIEQDILSKNNTQAENIRQRLAAKSIFSLNFVSSPGTGKTSLLVRTINDLKNELNFYVIEGDQQSQRDAERIRATGAVAEQINTGKGCHLDAAMVEHALDHLQPNTNAILFIENVGNLICPAAFDLGETTTVAMLSVTEGDDKPIKYPDIFADADIVLITKIDLLPYVDFDMSACLNHLKHIKHHSAIFQVSAKTGAGMTEWYQILRDGHASAVTAQQP